MLKDTYHIDVVQHNISTMSFYSGHYVSYQQYVNFQNVSFLAFFSFFFPFFLRGIACVIIQRMEELALHQALVDSFSFSLHNIQQTACGKGCEMQHQLTGPRLNIKTVFLGMEMSVLKIRRSRDRLIFNMGILILLRRHLYIDAAPWRYGTILTVLQSPG